MVGLRVGLLLIAGLAAFIGAAHTKIYGHDIFVLLDNGWRVLNGQRVHADYASPFGPLSFLIAALGLAITGNVNGIGVGSALFSLGVGTWAYFAGRARIKPVLLTLTCLFLAALVASPYPLGLTPFDSSHAMVYNRYGYALVGLVLIGGGISTGVALGLALFLKASYFAVGLGLVGVLFLFRRTKGLGGMAAGFAAVSLTLLWYLHFDLTAMLHDLQMAAGARASSLGFGIVLAKAVPLGSALLGIVLFGWVVSPRLAWLGALVFGADLLLLSTNSQSSGLPLVAVAAILFLNEIKAPSPAAWALAAVLFVPQFVGDLAGLGYGALRKFRAPPAAVFTSARLRPLKLYDGNSDPESNGTVFTTYVNEGVKLLESVASPRDKVLTMDMSNPFPYALGWRPPRGGLASVTYGVTLSDKAHPSAAEYFGDADIVMLPKHPAHDLRLWAAFYQIYEAELRGRFQVAAETDWWQLWKRK